MKGLRDAVPLAPHTTLELGGPARHLFEATSVEEAREALAWARARSLPAFFLGGGSNLIVPDEGFDGLVLAVRWHGLDVRRDGATAHVRVAAGEPWDDVVAQLVAEGLQGLECLSGIPGLAGGTVVQNVGAYGQDVGELVAAVEAIDSSDGLPRTLSREACGFGYRDSVFKRTPGRFLVTAVHFTLRIGGRSSPRYAELARALGHGDASLTETRKAVLALRRSKSMLLAPDDPNRRSVGSFFTNPVVEAASATVVAARAASLGLTSMPSWPQADGRVKLAAGWLVEHAGIPRGYRRGSVGVSSAHALALVHHGGGTTGELLALAQWVRERVFETFGVELEREAVLLEAPRPAARSTESDAT